MSHGAKHGVQSQIHVRNDVSDENDLHIVTGIADGIGTCSKEVQNRIEEHQAYKGIGEADLKVVPGNQAPTGIDVEAYEVFFQLADAAQAKEWYTYSNAGGYQPATREAINARLAEVEPALLYKNGMTYYYTDIRHLGSEGSAAEYGVVRNHIYKVNISKITGFGTPVYDPEVDIDVPERPKQVSSYVAAEVRVLSWKVVKNQYDVE